MAKLSKDASRGPMIHVRLDEKIHRHLKILVAQRAITIQQLVEDLIQREIGESGKSKTLGQGP
jgi:predicted HicB family RNase H-like nuclease